MKYYLNQQREKVYICIHQLSKTKMIHAGKRSSRTYFENKANYQKGKILYITVSMFIHFMDYTRSKTSDCLYRRIT